MSSLEELLKHQEEVAKYAARVMQQIHEQQAKTLVVCTDNVYGKGCGKKTQIGKLTYIQTHWYTAPSGCSGGDYWSEGEGRFVCPKCGHTNRLYDRKNIQALKLRFRAVDFTY